MRKTCKNLWFLQVFRVSALARTKRKSIENRSEHTSRANYATDRLRNALFPSLEASEWSPRAPQSVLRGVLGLSWALLARSWGALERSLGALRRSWGALGTLLGAFGALLGGSWDLLGAPGAPLGDLGSTLKPPKVDLGASERQFQ